MKSLPCKNSPTCQNRVTSRGGYCPSCKQLIADINAILDPVTGLRCDDREAVEQATARRIAKHRGRVAGFRLLDDPRFYR